MPRARRSLFSLVAAPAAARTGRSARPRRRTRAGGLALADAIRSLVAALERSARLRRLAAIAAVSAVVLVLGFMWFRDSSLVAIKQVRIVGVRGPEAALIDSALRSRARAMTTMDVDVAALRRSIAPYTVLAGLSVTTHFPHGITIDVSQRLPVAVLTGPGGVVTVAGDGTLLRGLTPPVYVPVLHVGSLPAAAAVVTDRGLRLRLALLGAAPDALLARVSAAFMGPHGLEVLIRRGPAIYFGDGSRLTAKWSAAARVLADPMSAGASYIDVRIPDRAAAEVGQSSLGSSTPTAAGTSAPSLTPGAAPSTLTPAGTAGSAPPAGTSGPAASARTTTPAQTGGSTSAGVSASGAGSAGSAGAGGQGTPTQSAGGAAAGSPATAGGGASPTPAGTGSQGAASAP